MKKVLVIGLDGATWDLIKPWAKEGRLPTFKMLMKEGVHGELESTVPSWTIPAWNSMTTGKNPGKLGVFSFMSRVSGSYKFVPYFFVVKKLRNIWDILSDTGRKVTILNLPNIHSSYRVNGYMIAGWLYQSEEALTYPNSLKDKIDKISNGYEVDVMEVDILTGEIIKHPTKDERYAKTVDRIMSKRFKILQSLLEEKWDLFFAVLTSPDRIQHRFWRDKKFILNCHKKIDTILRKLLQKIGKDVILVLVSDHGFGSRDRIFNINEWLIKKGYLKLKRKKTSPLLHLKLFLQKIQLYFLVKQWIRLLPFKFVRTLRKKSRPFGIERANVDWKNTKAFAYAVTGDMYINLKGRDKYGTIEPQEYETFREELIHELENLRDPDTGTKIHPRIYRKEEIYQGKELEKAPDLIIQVDSNINSVVPTIGTNKIFERGEKWDGTHRINGIFLAYGPGIKRGVEIKDAKIYDIAPTILHISNLPIPDDMDGRVLTEIFKEESEFTSRKVKFVKPEEQRIKDKIKKLRKTGKI